MAGFSGQQLTCILSFATKTVFAAHKPKDWTIFYQIYLFSKSRVLNVKAHRYLMPLEMASSTYEPARTFKMMVYMKGDA